MMEYLQELQNVVNDKKIDSLSRFIEKILDVNKKFDIHKDKPVKQVMHGVYKPNLQGAKQMCEFYIKNIKLKPNLFNVYVQNFIKEVDVLRDIAKIPRNILNQENLNNEDKNNDKTQIESYTTPEGRLSTVRIKDVDKVKL